MILQKPPEQSKWVERERPKHKTADFANNSKSGRRFMDYSFDISGVPPPFLIYFTQNV